MARWIQPTTRLAIYLRDGSHCVYCGRDATTGAVLSLDHVVPRSRGGGNEPTNLVTSCVSCNSSRQDLVIEHWLTLLGRSMGERHATSVAKRLENRHVPLKPFRRAARLFVKSLGSDGHDDWGQVAARASRG